MRKVICGLMLLWLLTGCSSMKVATEYVGTTDFSKSSMLEGVAGISSLLRRAPVERILFGSHLPFFILESAVLKLQESGLLPAQVEAITHGNAERVLRS